MKVLVYQLCIVIFLALNFSCVKNSKQEIKYIKHYKGTDLEQLVEAINNENIKEIEKLVHDNPEVLKYSDPLYGSGILGICINLEKYNSFKKLLELGADANYINNVNHYSILIESIKPFGTDKEWKEDNRYAFLLLNYKADPNNVVEKGFEDEKKYYHPGASPLVRASSLNLELVKKLIEHGAIIDKKIDGISPFASSVISGNYDISKYYIEFLGVKLDEPLVMKEKDSLFIQDLITNKYTLAKIQGDHNKINELKKINKSIDDANIKRWEMIEYLEKKGVNFKDYNYKKN